MKRNNRATGYLGEEAAVKYLKARNYDIVERNFSTRFGEIDIVYRDKEKLVFAEVKTKRSGDFGTPEEMFTRRKYDKVKRMATIYLGGRDVPCRIDMVAVMLDGRNQPAKIKLYENVTFTKQP
jgi:putative endonuclease